ncbi:hypothetical protein GF337_18310 [candidate division KSB1 bacterium]|nr:hypothetical protein [candidate division KSB1 bacterium]
MFGLYKKNYSIILKQIVLLLILMAVSVNYSCAPSISSMHKSANEVRSASVFYDNMGQIIDSETPLKLDATKTQSGKLSDEDGIVFIEDVVDKSYFDLYKIENKSLGNYQIESKTGPRALGFHGAYLITKLYLFKEGEEDELMLTSTYDPPSQAGESILSKIEVQLEADTNYYLLVCSDNEYLLQDIASVYVSGFGKKFYARNTGGYKLKLRPVVY